MIERLIRCRIYLQRGQSWMGLVNFALLVSIALKGYGLPATWVLPLTPLALLLIGLIGWVDYKIGGVGHEQSFWWRNNPEWNEMREDLQDVKRRLRRGLPVILLLLALPVHADNTPGYEDINEWFTRRVREIADSSRVALPYEWVTVRVDSANLGDDRCPVSDTVGGYLFVASVELPRHEWVNGPEDDEPWFAEGDGNIYRERICRICLRHEWQERREIPPPPSEFEVLREKLK